MLGLMALMRPAPFTLTKKGDLEQKMKEFAKYMKIFRNFLKVTGIVGNYLNNHVDCAVCQKAKTSLELFGDKEIMRLYERWKKEICTKQQWIRCQRVSENKLTKLWHDLDYSFKYYSRKVCLLSSILRVRTRL